MAKVELEVVKQAFNDLNIDHPVEDFIKSVEERQKAFEKQKKAEKAEKERIKDVNFVFESIPEGKTIDEFLDEWFEEYDSWDMFYDYDGIPDEGVSITELFLVGDKLYSVDLDCEAEWVGDWSVRKNLPGERSITRVEEVPSFELLERSEECARVKI